MSIYKKNNVPPIYLNTTPSQRKIVSITVAIKAKANIVLWIK